MSFIEQMKQKAKSSVKTIVLPEGSEPRTIRAAMKITAEGLCKVILLASEAAIKASVPEADLASITTIDPKTSPDVETMAAELFELRKAKGLTMEKAREFICDPLYFGTMMVQLNKADGMVAGAINSTGDVLRPPLQIIKTAPGITTVSSCMIMECPHATVPQGQFLAFADCAVNPNPDAAQLASIAVATASTYHTFCGDDPKVAMLSFSTKGSGKHADADKVIEATRLAKEMAPTLQIDGELQADAALVDSVGKLKSPGSTVAGEANVLVFPDLDAANIGYKLVQRLGSAEAVGPIIQGLRKPVNDLSRGCSVDDIVAVTAITAVLAQN